MTRDMDLVDGVGGLGARLGDVVVLSLIII